MFLFVLSIVSHWLVDDARGDRVRFAIPRANLTLVR